MNDASIAVGLVVIALPLTIFVLVYGWLPRRTWTMDPGGERWAFLGLFELYQQAFRNLSLVAITLAAVEWWIDSPVAPVVLASSAVLCVAWQLVTIHFYEMSQHRPESYTSFRYALVTSLGISTVLQFTFGIMAAVAHGAKR